MRQPAANTQQQASDLSPRRGSVCGRIPARLGTSSDSRLFPIETEAKRQHQLSRRDLIARAASPDPGGPYSIYCIEPGVTPLALLVFLWPMPKRLEDRIKDLCAKAVGTPASPQLDEILQQLQSALSEHTQRIRKMVAAYPARVARRSDDRD